jgi:hypothetical protein
MEKVREVAKHIRTLLKNDGVNVKIKDIVEDIKNKDLTDINALKIQIADTIKSRPILKMSGRKVEIKKYFKDNYSNIKDNEAVKDAFIEALCRGRYDKEQRAALKQSIINECENIENIENIESGNQDDNLDF